ncbi:hypothetical protein HZ326_20055 [Fusarium oxysporum f. sp. albedinis]|nr:hypothetical protein HZ326_20055 [Fusarium oxysporum f. sp. albedinis]
MKSSRDINPRTLILIMNNQVSLNIFSPSTTAQYKQHLPVSRYIVAHIAVHMSASGNGPDQKARHEISCRDSRIVLRAE